MDSLDHIHWIIGLWSSRIFGHWRDIRGRHSKVENPETLQGCTKRSDSCTDQRLQPESFYLRSKVFDEASQDVLLGTDRECTPIRSLWTTLKSCIASLLHSIYEPRLWDYLLDIHTVSNCLRWISRMGSNQRKSALPRYIIGCDPGLCSTSLSQYLLCGTQIRANSAPRGRKEVTSNDSRIISSTCRLVNPCQCLHTTDE